jgi:hypothetical protein
MFGHSSTLISLSASLSLSLSFLLLFSSPSCRRFDEREGFSDSSRGERDRLREEREGLVEESASESRDRDLCSQKKDLR